MSLVLILEGGPRPQARQQALLDEGELVIGRGATADWQIEDPDMFVSRAHCTVQGGPDGYFVTDTSSSGLFLDDSSSPLGHGNTAPLRHGTRLRLGDYVLWAEIDDARRHASRPNQVAPEPEDGLAADDFFSAPLPDRSERPRPQDLPDPFDQPVPGAYAKAEPAPERPASPAFDDPFSLDPLPSPPDPHEPPSADPGFGDFATPPASPNGSASVFGFDDAFGFASSRASSDRPAASPAPPHATEFAAAPEPRRTAPAPAPAGQPQPARAMGARFVPASQRPVDARAGLDAFLRAAGIDPAAVADSDAEAVMAKLGREYRAMMEGLMLLLRKRAEEKNNARVAATVVGASDVNPLKFMPRVEDALEIVVSGRSPGFLSGEPAIEDAVRDLAHHHLRAWRGVQTALRRMIDRFDPAQIEQELKDASAVGTLLSGGRSAKLWELYKKRHHEISRSAEERFMGEVGADFRNAYEEE